MASSPHTRLSICCQLILLILQVGIQMAQSEITLQVIEGASEYHPPTVTLRCDGGDDSDPVAFFIEGDHEGTTRNITYPGRQIGRELTIEIDVMNEGIYYCMIEGQISNKEPLVAIPFSAPDIIKTYSVELGGNVVLPCTIPIGPLRSRYNVRWFKGINEVNPSPLTHIRQNQMTFALEFNGVKVSDDSRAYFCEVNVSRREGYYHRRGATVALNVVDTLRLRRGLSRRAVQVGEAANFTCLASGVPAPQFKWLLNGTETAIGVSGENETRMSTIDVESSLVLSTTVGDTGPVTCVAFHEREGQTFTVTSTANLVVLTGNFKVELRVFQGDEVRIEGTLPVLIAGFFSLRVRFTNNVTEENIDISDSSLADTDKINVVVPREKLPSFSSFQVSVAIRSNDKTGPFTAPSNLLNLPPNFPHGCNRDCGSSGSNSSFVAVVSVLVVLVVVGIIILGVTCTFFFFYKKGVVDTKLSREFTLSPRGTMSRSASRNSYGSHKSSVSSKSSRSRSYSAHSSEGGHSAAIYANISTPVPGSRAHSRASLSASPRASAGVTETPKDIRDFETIDHKMLKQWQEKRGHPESRLGGSCEQVAPEKPRVNEPPQFPHTHIGVPNPHIGVPNPHQQRDSGSSFEDLESECLELSVKSR